MKRVVLEVAERNAALGRGTLNRLREKGSLPAVVYGPKVGTVAITVDKKKVMNILNTNGINAIVHLKIGDRTVQSMIKEIQTHPVTGHYQHIDFAEVSMNKKIRADIPLSFKGEPRGVQEGGTIQYGDTTVEVECLPGDIPESLEVDITDLGIGDKLTVDDLSTGGKVKVLSEGQQILISIIPPAVEEIAEEVKEDTAESVDQEK